MKSFKQIAIVGTGPGDPNHLTLRAINYINQADVVLYDCLVDEITLTIVPLSIPCERIEKKFRKSNGIDIFDQEILQRMLYYLKKGKKVVRIKPGDSMNYNSGGMEADYLISMGYDVEMVPGIPTHLAASNLLKLNLTEIGQSNGFISFMADELGKDNHLVSHLSYLIQNGGIPICLYGMRVESFPVIAELFLANGMDEKMPVAICGDVSLDSSKLICTNLRDCSDLAALMDTEGSLPDHFVVFAGKYLLKNYVEFKSETIKAPDYV